MSETVHTDMPTGLFEPITVDQFIEWSNLYFGPDGDGSLGLRYGQSFIVRMLPTVTDPELFYERSAGIAGELIMSRGYVNITTEI